MGGDDLAATHDRVRKAASRGQATDFSRPDDDGELAPYDDEAAWEGRTVDGAWLAEWLTSGQALIHQRGLHLTRARIVGDLNIDHAELKHPLVLESCQLGEHVVTLQEATLRSLVMPGTRCGGLYGRDTQVAGVVVLSGGFVSTGPVYLVGADIGGVLDVSGADLSNPGGHTVDLRAARVGRSVLFRRGRMAGEVRLRGMSIGGDLICSAAAFVNLGGRALHASWAQIAGSVYLQDGFSARGEVRLEGAAVIGNIDASGARLSHDCGYALYAPTVHVSGNVLLRDGFTATGQVHLEGATVGGHLLCTGARLSGGSSDALNAGAAHIARDVSLNGADVIGAVRLVGASIGGNLDCSGAELANHDGDALDAASTRIGGSVSLADGFRSIGAVGLFEASAAALADARSSWPERMDLRGFRYAQLYSPDRSWRDRVDWLHRQVEPSTQPFRQLATVYQNAGDERDARKVLMERHNTSLRRPEQWRPALPASWILRFGHRVWRTVLRYTIGHGYEPWRALYFALPILLGMTWWYADARDHDTLVPTSDGIHLSSECTSAYPCVQPAVLALDNLVPVVDFGQGSRWTPDQSRQDPVWHRDGSWLATATWFTSALGWVLAALVAAGFTNVVRRE